MFSRVKLQEGLLRTLGDPGKYLLVRRENHTTQRNSFEAFLDSHAYYNYTRENADKTAAHTHHEIFYGEIKCFGDLDAKISEDPLRVPGANPDPVDFERRLCQSFTESMVGAMSEVYTCTVPGNNVLWFSSSDTEKISAHVVLDGMCFADPFELKHFVDRAKTRMGIYAKFVDMGPYARFKQLRILGERKMGTNRVKRHVRVIHFNGEEFTWVPRLPIEPCDPADMRKRYLMEASLVTATYYCRRLVRCLQAATHLKDERIVEEPIMAWVIANCIPAHCVFREIKGPMVLLTRLTDQASPMCDVCGVIHETDSPYLFITETKQVLLDCRRSLAHVNRVERSYIATVPENLGGDDDPFGDMDFEAALTAMVMPVDNAVAPPMVSMPEPNDDDMPVNVMPAYLKRRLEAQEASANKKPQQNPQLFCPPRLHGIFGALSLHVA